MFCSNCGKKLNGERFCPDCGASTNPQQSNRTPKSPVSVSSFDKNKIIIIGFLAVYLLFLLFNCIKMSVPVLESSLSLPFYRLPFFVFQFGDYLDYMGDSAFFLVVFWLAASISEVYMVVFCIHGLLAVFQDTSYDAISFFKKASYSAICLSAIVILAIIVIRSAISSYLDDFRALEKYISIESSSYYLLIIGIIGAVIVRKLEFSSYEQNSKTPIRNAPVKTYEQWNADKTTASRIEALLADETLDGNATLDISCPGCQGKLSYNKQALLHRTRLVCPYCNYIIYNR